MQHDVRCGPVAELDSTERVLPARPSPPHLLIVAADGTWTSRPLLADGTLTIGRGVEGVEVDVRVNEQAVSRRHARLEVTGTTELRLVDLGSANGTVVGEKFVRDAGVTVWPGEPILIGRTVLAVHAPQPVRADDEGPPPSRKPGLALAGVDSQIGKIAPTLISVLLLGETGVGKDVVAECLHRQSPRAAGPLVRLNCAGLSAALLESELFGHERGAFTGAAQAKPGLLEAAAGGTVFLDEIAEMPMEVQAKLLLAIEQRVVRRVGATRSTPIDVRFISATHRDLVAEIRRDRFRADFYYRINGLTIRIPPLRERRDEIAGLIWQFARDTATRMGMARPPVFDEDARAILHHYHWPGNIRQLRSIVEGAVHLVGGNLVTPCILVAAGLPVDAALPPDECKERDELVAALARCGGNQSRVARELKISRNTVRARMQKFGLVFPRRGGGLR